VKALFYIVLMASVCLDATAAPKRKKKAAAVPPPAPAPTVITTKPEARRFSRGLAETPAGRISRFKLINAFGVHALAGGGVNTGGQFGYTPNNSMRFYWGPAMDFTLFSKGTLLNFLGGFWYEWKWPGSDSLYVHLGALAGIGFAKYVPGLSPTNLVAYVDTALATEIDDLVTLRGQLRPGFVGNRFAFLVNFNVMFRFY